MVDLTLATEIRDEMIQVARSLADRDCGAMQSEMREAQIEYLATRISNLSGVGWRDISTAPKDGTEILALGDQYGRPVRFVAIWNGLHWYAGWGDSIQPTHFQPLPAPPEQSDKPHA